MPRILRIINRLNLGGPTYNAALLTKYMAPEYETLLVAGARQDSEGNADFIVENLGLSYTPLPEMKRELHFPSDRKAYTEIRKLIRQFRPDIVHTHAAKPGTLGRLAAFHEKVPVVVHTFHGHVFHSYFSPLTTRLFLGIERYLARRSSAIVAISERQKQELVNEFRVCNAAKTHVVPLGFDLTRFHENQDSKRSEFRRRYGIGDEEIAIGIIGRLVPVKNHDLFLDCIQKLLAIVKKRIKVLVIGDGEERHRLLTRCRNAGMQTGYFPEDGAGAQVLFTSWIKEVDVAVSGLDIVVLTSKNEGTPVSLIEAQAGGRPVVSTRVGGIENVILEGQTGLLCDSGDADCLVAQLHRLVEDDDFRGQMGRSGWDHVKARYHYTRLVSDMSKLYHSLLQ